MLRKLVVLMNCMLLTGVAAADCVQPRSGYLGASYTVTETRPGSHQPHTRQVILWRANGQVAHQYVDAGITEIWQKIANGRLRLVRYFDSHKRAIEYEPGDMKTQQGGNDWSLKSQLISDQLIASMRHVASASQGCEPVDFYTADVEHKQLQLEWLSQSRLVRKFMEISAQGIVQWQLQEVVSDEAQVNELFASRSAYYSTDYADVGDNESDPFLLGMMNLGFIEHGSSGFYDEHGHTIGSGHAH